jgi:hypothetical protein
LSIVDQNVKAAKADETPQFLSFPLDIGAHSVLLVFNKYSFIPPGDSVRKLNRLGSNNRGGITGPVPIGQDAIQLPLPANIQETFSLRSQTGDMGIAGAAVASAASAFGGAGDISDANVTVALKRFLNDAGFNPSSLLSTDLGQIGRNLAFLGRRSIDRLLPGAGRNIDAGLGNTTNPKAAIYFEGVNLKQFDFRWTLAPTEFAESDRLRDIINIVRKRTLPTYGNAIGLNKVLLNYPSTVDIYFLGVEQQYFLYYKTCMVQQFETNFTPNGLTFVAGGKPAMVTINMTFMEMDIHTSEDYGGISTNNINLNNPRGLPADPSQPGPQ